MSTPDAPTTSPALRRCERCRNLIDPDDLFCASCGNEAPRLAHEVTAAGRRPDWEVYAFHCNGCGASMSFDARQGALSCPFCGASEVEERPAAEGIVYPEQMIPFHIDRDAAVERFRAWLGKGFWRPGDLEAAAAIDAMKALLLPCWSFSGNAHTHWTADVGARTRSGWRPASGERRDAIAHVLVPASQGLGEAELAAIAGFRFEGLIETDRRYLQVAAVEAFGVTRKGARLRARAAFERAVAGLIEGQIGGRTRNVHVNTLVSEMTSVPILLPVWIFAYRYKGAPYRFVMNGQTGISAGKAPFSYAKLFVILGAVAAALGALTAAVTCLGVLGSAL